MKYKEWLRRYGKWVGYPLFYLFTFVLFLRLVFPYERLRDRIVYGFNSQARSGTAQQELQIDEVRGYWLTGVRVTGIRLISAPTEPGKPPGEIKVDEARLKVGVLAAIFGRTSASFQVDAMGGEIDGTYDESSKERAVDVDFDGIELKNLDALTQTVGLPVEGKAHGTINLTMPEGKASKGSGVVNVEVSDTAIGDGKAKLKNALDWPKLNVGQLTFNAEAKEGVLKVTKFSAGGKDLELSGDGKVQMRDLSTESGLDINLKFKINDGYRGKSDMTKALFGAPGSAKGGDIDRFVPEMRSAQRSDGFYAFRIQGLLGHPRFEPESGTGGRPDREMMRRAPTAPPEEPSP